MVRRVFCNLWTFLSRNYKCGCVFLMAPYQSTPWRTQKIVIFLSFPIYFPLDKVLIPLNHNLWKESFCPLHHLTLGFGSEWSHSFSWELVLIQGPLAPEMQFFPLQWTKAGTLWRDAPTKSLVCFSKAVSSTRSAFEFFCQFFWFYSCFGL